jgi:glycosyltransferase involved in cell wall biosynthesis
LELSIRRGLPASKLHLVPNGLETQPPVTDSERTQARLSLGVTAGDFVLVTAARLVRHKRVEACIDVAARLPGVRLFIAGDGPMRGELEDRARALGLAGRVAFTGTLDSLRRLLAAGDVFLLCSEREGTSNALLEAMQCGCVPLATDAGDNRHIVPRTGWILPPDQMAAAILKMASQKGLFHSWREEARKAAGRYSIEAMVAGTLKVYHRVQPVTHLRPACGEVG